MSKKKRIIGGSVTALLLLVILGGIYFSQNIKTNSTTNNKKYEKVKITPPVSINGKIKSKEEKTINIPPKSEDNQVTVFAQDEQHVNKGDIIYSENKGNINQQIYDAQEQLNSDYRKLDLLQSSLLQKKQNNDKNSGTSDNSLDIREEQNQIADITAEINGGIKKVDTLKNKATQNYYAPFSGTLTQRSSNSFDLYSDSIEAIGYVSEFDYFKVSKANEVSVESIINKTKEKSSVLSLSKVPNDTKSEKAEYRFKVDIKKKFLLGQSVKLLIPNKTLIVPNSAIIHTRNNYYVYIRDNQGDHKKEVKGYYEGSLFYVTSGISEKDLVKIKSNTNKAGE